MVREVRAAGLHTCEINLAPSDNARVFEVRRYGPVTEIVPAWVEEILMQDSD
jgi:NAD-dependent deacetylase